MKLSKYILLSVGLVACGPKAVISTDSSGYQSADYSGSYPVQNAPFYPVQNTPSSTPESQDGARSNPDDIISVPENQPPQTPASGLCQIQSIQVGAYPEGRYQVAQKSYGNGRYKIYYPQNYQQLTQGGCKLPVIGWANGMTVGRGGAFPSDLVYGRTIKTVASHGYIVVAAQIEGKAGGNGQEVANGVESVIRSSEFSSVVSQNIVGNMGHSMGGGATLYAGQKLSKPGRKVALCPIQGVTGPSTTTAPTLYLSGTGDNLDSGWSAHRGKGGIKMFSQIRGATHMSWYRNADANHYGGACAMWFDCILRRDSNACKLAGGSYFEALSSKWTRPEKNF